MNLHEVQNLALTLMTEHNLNWSFGFNQRKRAIGVCIPSKRKIELSIPFVRALDINQVTDTILHEIAHALEAVAKFDDNIIHHGEAVMLGLLCATRLAQKRNLIDKNLETKIDNLLLQKKRLDKLSAGNYYTARLAS